MTPGERPGERPDEWLETEARGRLERARRQVGLVVGFIGLLAVVSVAGLVVLLWPWSGMEVYSFEPTKAEVCPMEIVGAERDYRIDPAADVYRVEVEPLWIAVDVPGVEEGSVLRGPDAAYSESETRPGRRTVTSTVLRVAPPQPGEWRMGSVTTVRATPYPLPVTKVQEIEVRSSRTVTVREADHPKCVTASFRASQERAEKGR